MKKSVMLFCSAALGLSASFCGAQESRVSAQDLFRGQRLLVNVRTNDLAIDRQGEPWEFAKDDHCNFTYFSPEVKDLAVDEKGMRFNTSGERAILGWGNYDGRQARSERIQMFSGLNEIELRVRQSATSSVWKAALWSEGQAPPRRRSGDNIPWWANPEQTLTVTGTDWQTVQFRMYRAGPDGFGLTIEGPEDNAIEIESIRVSQPTSRGYYRRSIELPKGKVWRAVCQIRTGVKLSVNGVEVPVRSVYQPTAPVDIAPYLEPGKKNVVCLYAEQLPTARDLPVVFFQGNVIMHDGTVLNLDTGPGWSETVAEQSDWEQPEFDDSGWSPAAAADMDLGSPRRWPAYDGRLLLENPGKDPLLYYDDEAAVLVNVRVPEGLATGDTAVNWTLRRVERENRRPETGRGAVQEFERQGRTGSAIYSVDAGRREQGVYTLEVEFTSGGQVVERRFEEPLIVTGRLPMKEVAGDYYEEGMELELEKVIDFTDPDDPHRWIEVTSPGTAKSRNDGEPVSTPRIITKDGMKYREVTDSGIVAMFSYRFEFKRPYSWYMMVLEYPNDAERWIGVNVVAATRIMQEPARAARPFRMFRSGYNTTAGPSLATGGKYPLDNTMREMRWLHWADPEIHTLDIVNLREGLPSAAARVRIYRVKELPAVKIDTSGERFFGIHTERARSLGKTFGDSDPGPYQGHYDKLGYDMVARFTERLRFQFVAARNYTAYLRFTGQNLHVMGSYQYAEDNTAYTPPENMPGDGRLLQDIRDPALRFFERNGITMYSMMEYIGHRSVQAEYRGLGDVAVGEGADTISFVDKDGKQGGWHGNPNHPAVEEGYLRVVDDLAAKYAHSPAWKGIYYCVYVDGGGFGPAPLAPRSAPFDYDYSDATIAAFERDTGIKVPGAPSDPKRFEQRYLFLTSEAMLDKWVEWRCLATRGYITRTLETLHRHRNDLNVLYGFHSGTAVARYWLFEADRDYASIFRDMGMDPSVVKDDQHIWFGRYIYPTGAMGGRAAHNWAQIVRPEPIAYYDVGPNRMTVLNTCWHELTTRPGEVEGWPVPNLASRFISQAHDDNVMEPFTQAMIGADPDMLVFGFTDVNIINSREQHVREVARVLTPLPKEKFESVLGTADFKHNLAIRALRKGSDYWLYVANPGYWPIKGEVVLSRKAAVVRPNDGRTVETREADGKTIVPIELKPYGMAAFKVQGRRTVVEAWRNEPLDESDLAHMRGIMRTVRELLDDPNTALALTRENRDFMRAVLARAEEYLQADEYAACWAELTDGRFWTLWKENLEQAREFSARLPDRPDTPDSMDTWERPVLQAVAVKGAPPVIDGRLDDAVWKEAPANFRFLSIGRGLSPPYVGIPPVDTSVQACYDDKNIYLALRMADADLQALRKTASQDKPIEVLRKYDDTVVMFLNAESSRVRQFAVNAGGVKYFAGSGEWHVGQDDLRGAEWEAAASVADGYWTIEAAIPFTALEMDAPAAGTQWRCNFVRRFREFLVPESYWARIKGSWSDVDYYGKLMFQ